VIIDRDLAGRLERLYAIDCAEFALSHAARIPDSSAGVLRVGGGLAAVMGARMHINKVMALGLDEPMTDAVIDEFEAFFAERKLDVELHLCPWVDAADVELLGRRGYRVTWFRNLYIMETPAAVPTRDPVGFALEPVDDSNFSIWQQTHGAGFTDDPAAAADNAEFCLAVQGAGGAMDFIAKVEDVPVGVCSLIVRDGRAWLGGMTTLPRYRRLGIQSTLIRHRLRIARKMGCDIAVTSADIGNDSSRNIERHGFQCAYTMFGMKLGGE
jgi:GNAT superfamily N-acetyltransferase